MTSKLIDSPSACDTPERVASGLNVSDLFEDQVAMRPGETALQAVEGNWTFAELGVRVDRLCALLQSLGVSRGDRIAVLSENRREFAQTLLAAAKLGAIVCCMNWRQSSEELAHCIELVGPKAALVSPRNAHNVALFSRVAAQAVLCFGERFEAALAAQHPGPSPERVQPEDGLYILYTSGTTGKPKAAMISHRALLARGAVGAMDGGVRRCSTFIAWPPMFHMASADNMLVTLLGGGAR